ncbi:MAG: helix-turn-helix domain-containing protein [Clostridia bacterium]
MELLKNYNDYLTVNDIYNILPVGRTKIYTLIRNGRIKAKLVGNKYVISKVSLIKFMENTEKENYDE